MKFWVGVTDNTWFSYLSTSGLDEVNFWQPSATPPFRPQDAPTDMPFLFKLKRPNNHIAGGGFFVTYSRLPLALAWEVFGPKNGAASLDDLRATLDPLTSNVGLGTEIGCTVLANPFFLPREDWIVIPSGFADNIVRGKFFQSESGDGAAIWEAIEARLATERYGVADDRLIAATPAAEPGEKYGNPVLMKPRLGQASFRVLVMDAYKRRCAITGENTLLALEAAHIVPYKGAGTHDVRNGLLLRADFHRLFDVGLVSVTPDLQIKVSPKIREAWFNGKVYYNLNNQPLSVVPEAPGQRPDPDLLKWHYETLFQA
jgi:putative restriction endonuclease